MKKMYLIIAVVLMVAVSAGVVMANKPNQINDGEFHITITPNVLKLSSKDTIVTVHSNIPYGIVDTLSLKLDGIDATYTKADDCGDLVVKFEREDVKEIVEPGLVTLTLSGQLTNGQGDFEVSDTITVIE